MEIEDRIQKLATWYAARMKQDERTNGDKYYHFVGQGDEDREVGMPRSEEGEKQKKAEETSCRNLAMSCHNDGSMLPDDWRYEFLHDALNLIADASDIDDIQVEADVYTHDLLRWSASRNDRTAYCDEAVSEGLCPEGADMDARITAGQYMERSEVLQQVLSFLRGEAESEEEEEEDEEETEEESAEA